MATSTHYIGPGGESTVQATPAVAAGADSRVTNARRWVGSAAARSRGRATRWGADVAGPVRIGVTVAVAGAD